MKRAKRYPQISAVTLFLANGPPVIPKKTRHASIEMAYDMAMSSLKWFHDVNIPSINDLKFEQPVQQSQT